MSCARRKESTTAPQSLILLNSDFSVANAEALAKRFLAEQKEDADVDSLAKLALALINLNEFLFVD